MEFFFLNIFQPIFTSTFLFFIGVCGIVLNRKNILLILMSIELLLLAVNLNFLFFSLVMQDLVGQVFAFFLLTVAAAESAIGLAILVVHHRLCGTIAVEWLHLLKGLYLVMKF